MNNKEMLKAVNDAIEKLIPSDAIDNDYLLGIIVGLAQASSCVELIMEQYKEELLTDREQRIFLAAMAREEIICRKTDQECRNCSEPYEDILVLICNEIVRKVKGALWTV